jgi:hypothetical protein
MRVGTQFTGTIAAGKAVNWFTHSWDPAEHVVWTVVPVTAGPGAAQVEWSVKVQRASATAITYWILVQNLSAAELEVELRFAVLS